jgi:hypothetical protein
MAMTIISSMRVKPFLLSFFLIFVSIGLLLSIWFIIKLLSDLSETLYGDASLYRFHLLSRILASFFFFRLGFDAICLPTKSDCSEIVPCKDVM